MDTSKARDRLKGASTKADSTILNKHPCQGIPGLWSIVLAGGEGNRIRPFIQGWLGRHRPKQYCTFVGTRSLLQHTLERAVRLAPEERTLVVIDRSHQQFAEPQLVGNPLVRLVPQPSNRDTASGIFLPLTYVRHANPQATVVLYPSDHFVYPENPYIHTVLEAVEAVSFQPERLVLLGVAPDSIELEYGWIQPGPEITGNAGRVRSVRAFIEKPGEADARAALESGALWNTFVLVAKVELLWRLGHQFFPQLMSHFESLADALGTVRETQVLNSVYASMPSLNFSSELLQRVPEYIGVMKLEGVLWSDWGRPERIINSLKKIDRQPAFSAESLHNVPVTA